MAGKSKKELAARQRHMWVFIGLTSSLSATALFLHVLSPVPLAASGGSGLVAQEEAEGTRHVDYQDAATPAPWRFIYIHHSGSAAGDLRSLATTSGGVGDHFVIGNGTGMADGEVEPGPRWRQQRPAATPQGLRSLTGDCISICLVGDMDQTSATPAQLSQLARLVRRLQAEHRIPDTGIFMRQQPGTPAGIGQKFQTEELKRLLAR